jgi:hypothetical protein
MDCKLAKRLPAATFPIAPWVAPSGEPEAREEGDAGTRGKDREAEATEGGGEKKFEGGERVLRS